LNLPARALTIASRSFRDGRKQAVTLPALN
jgi:hypothetical protein